MPSLFVTATGTDLGKTHVAAALVRELVRRGRPVDVLKPVLSGFDDPAASDAGRLLEALGRPLSEMDRISPLRFAAPLAPPSAARAEGRSLLAQDLIALCRDRMGGEALLLIEGAGGVMSPLAEDATNLDIIAALKTPVLLVTGSYLGAISHALTAIVALRSRDVAIAAIVVSESEGEAPPLDEILNGLARFAPGIPIFIAPRRESFDASALADAL